MKPTFMVFHRATGKVVHARFGRTKREAMEYAAHALNKRVEAVQVRYEVARVSIIREDLRG